MNEKNHPSPILRQAIAEIKAIAEKYDIGAQIILASKDHGEYLLHFPTWSKAQLEDIPDSNGKTGIRFKPKGKDEDGTIASTVHFIQVIQEASGHLFMEMDKILKELDEDGTIASTVHFIQVIQETSGHLFMGMDKILKELNERMIIEGGPERVR